MYVCMNDDNKPTNGLNQTYVYQIIIIITIIIMIRILSTIFEITPPRPGSAATRGPRVWHLSLNQITQRNNVI